MACSWLAPAKLNLYLHVTGRRGDGFHELDSLVAFASVGDAVAVEPAPALALKLYGPFAAELAADPTGNLVWRAAGAFAARLGVAPGVAISLRKNLPVASGIGGGSSDAAACLRILADLWRCEDRAIPRAVAATLGSDVPACLAARPAWLGGIGEQVEDAPDPPECGVLLVNPRVALPTPAVYRAFRGPFSAPARFAIPRDPAAFAARLAERRNDLTTPAIGLVPAIATILDRLAKLDGVLLTRMSGSGATCFALFASEAEARSAALAVARERREWWVEAGKLLSGAAPLSLAP